MLCPLRVFCPRRRRQKETDKVEDKFEPLPGIYKTGPVVLILVFEYAGPLAPKRGRRGSWQAQDCGKL